MASTEEKISANTDGDGIGPDAWAVSRWEEVLRDAVASNDPSDFRAAVKAARGGKGLNWDEVKAMVLAAANLGLSNLLPELVSELDSFDQRRFKDGTDTIRVERHGVGTRAARLGDRAQRRGRRER